MRCFVLDEPREPLQLAELPDPVPKPGEVLLRVEACGVCHSDLHLADGDWPDNLARRVRPTILGHEIVGTVVALGSAVRSLAIGQRVGVGWVGETCANCDACLEGDDNLCERRLITGVDRQGGWATLVPVHSSQAVPVPDELDPVAAAPLFCAGVTVYRSMKKAAIRAGDRVAVFGVGGLGHIAVQLAAMWGAEAIAVDSGGAQRDLSRDLGATHVLPPDGAAKAILSGGGAHVAVVTAASARVYRDAFRSLRRGGTLVVVGLPVDPLKFGADEIAMKEARIVGSVVGSRADTREILALAAQGRVRCVTEEMPLDRVNEALDRMRQGSVRGRIVLVP